jgi:hypothetical protein
VSSSLHGGRILFNPDLYQDDEAFDTAFARVLVNNALHFADEAAQVRVNWPPTATGRGIAVDIVTNGVPVHIARFQFPIHVREDGSGYDLRIRLHARITQASDTITYTARISAPGVDYDTTFDAGITSETFDTVSTTGAWLTPDGDNIIKVPPYIIDAATRSVSTLDAVGGNPVGVLWPVVELNVFGQRDSGSTSEPELTGLYVAEYIGT